MKVYSMRTDKIDPDDRRLYKYLSERRIEKVEKLKNMQSKAQSIGAELLLGYAVRRETGARGIVKWDTDMNGKPYLAGHSGLYVNLSHSGDYAVCALHNKPVGVDIQLCRDFDTNIAKRFFTQEEFLYIENRKNSSDAFFEIWTKKESFTKAVGKGISMGISGFSVLGDSVEYENTLYHFKEYSVSERGYKMFVCYLL